MNKIKFYRDSHSISRDMYEHINDPSLVDELDKWESVRYRMSDEGIEYCFKHYSTFSEIEDEQFHSKREKLIELMVDIEEYVQNKITEIEDEITKLTKDE
jgi:hypothetical protein